MPNTALQRTRTHAPLGAQSLGRSPSAYYYSRIVKQTVVGWMVKGERP